MLGLGALTDARHVLDALSKSQAIIEFDLDGRILTANKNFCTALGYQLSEIVGKHHSIFCEASTIASSDYKEFWRMLKSGAFDAGMYKRVAKDGREVWIQASYNAVCKNGKPYKVVKFAADVTSAKDRAVEDAGKLDAISRSQAMIEFTPSGEIITANPNFCGVLGYDLSEIIGKHHSIFCRRDYVSTPAYGSFWTDLAAGQFIANEFVRIAKGGREVWIQAAYNPILNSAGKVVKVVKFATDVTERMGAINDVNMGMRALSQGDLTQSLDRPFVPSMEDLRKNFNTTVSHLRATMEQINGNITAMADGTREISNNSDSFSKRTEQQAASLEQTAAALEEITTTVNDSSGRAQEAGSLVARTKEGAEQSGDVVRKAVAAMDEIQRSSGEITSIIGVIDEIAFQTNLLALNAGVEAARAGDAGKGFAVVAQEVRELAQRSAKAAKEIKTLIKSSTELVKNGVDLVGQTGRSLEQIVGQVIDIDTNVVAIVEAAREQAVGLKEINVAVNSMDQATQQNAAIAEESTAASTDLANQAAALKELVAFFNVGNSRQAPSKPQSRNTSSSSPIRSTSRATLVRSVSTSAAVADWQEF